MKQKQEISKIPCHACGSRIGYIYGYDGPEPRCESCFFAHVSKINADLAANPPPERWCAKTADGMKLRGDK